MITINKYDLPFYGEVELNIPYGSQFLSAKMQDRKLVLFAIVDSEATVETRRFKIYSTGKIIDRINLNSLKFISTIQDEHWCEAWHVFEITK